MAIIHATHAELLGARGCDPGQRKRVRRRASMVRESRAVQAQLGAIVEAESSAGLLSAPPQLRRRTAVAPGFGDWRDDLRAELLGDPELSGWFKKLKKGLSIKKITKAVKKVQPLKLVKKLAPVAAAVIPGGLAIAAATKVAKAVVSKVSASTLVSAGAKIVDAAKASAAGLGEGSKAIVDGKPSTLVKTSDGALAAIPDQVLQTAASIVAPLPSVSTEPVSVSAGGGGFPSGKTLAIAGGAALAGLLLFAVMKRR